MNKLNIKQLGEMLNLQATMNATVDPNWISAGYPFLRAVVVEASEALEHVGWKWWKKQELDIDQVRIELIDILHFYLSAILIKTKGNADLAALSFIENSSVAETVEFDGQQYVVREQSLLELLELLAGLAAARRVEVCVLEECFKLCGLNWQEVVKIYISKNLLNIFRQKHGYKDGTYVKIWNGEEDNVVLTRVANSINMNNAGFSSELYSFLENEYLKALANR